LLTICAVDGLWQGKVQRVLILEMDNYVKNSVDVRIYNLNRSGRCFCLPFSKKYGTVSRMSDGRSRRAGI
jgi:hypothetical protein